MSEQVNVSRLVTFLGVPQVPREGAPSYEGYALTTYRLYNAAGEPAGPECSTPWIAVALAEFFRPREAHVLATREAWENRPPGANRTYGEALGAELARRGIRVERKDIPTGLSAAEFWEQFQTLKACLRGAPEDGILLDITHGLRSQPFFAGAVLGFVSMVDRARPDLRIAYGAHDLIRTLELDHAPVVELTPFVDLVDWTHDLVLLLESGRLGRLIRRMRAPGRVLREKWQNGVKLASALEAFARDLQTIRTGSLLLGGTDDSSRRSPSSARTLLEAVERARADVEAHLPPLADVLDRIRDMAKPLVFDGDALVGQKGRDVLAALAELYLEMGRYIEALTTVREAMVSIPGPAAIARPGLPDYDHALRLERERGMKALWGHRYDDIAQFRNDLDHAGYQERPRPPRTLIDAAERLTKQLRELSVPQAVFANVSNHPSTDWDEAQRAAALRLADRIVDVPFPEVPPAAEEQEVEQLAADLLGKLPEGTTHAMVQGEFTLTMELVRRLQQKGIRCVAATTERRVERTEDGREERTFRFVRFRDYPQLA